MKISLAIILTMFHYIVTYLMSHCYIRKLGFNTRFIILGPLNIWFIILKFNIGFIVSSISVYDINPLGLLLMPWV